MAITKFNRIRKFEKFTEDEINLNDENCRWKPITIPFEEEEYSHYYINENGQIWNSITKVCLKTPTNNSGYNQACLHSKSKKQTVKNVGFLVACTFLYEEYMKLVAKYGYEETRKSKKYAIDVNHKNGIKLDNSVANLSWILHSKNIGEPRCKRLRSEIFKKLWATPEWREKQVKLIREANARKKKKVETV